MTDKKGLRKTYKARRAGLSYDAIDSLSLDIANKALELPIWEKRYYHVFLTISEKKEIQTEYLLHILQGKDKSIVIPKAHFDTGEMEHILLEEQTAIKSSSFGIPEPVEGIALPAKTIDVVFVPLLAFDLEGNRVGYGKGFYDRFLAQCRPDCLKIGLSLFDAETEIEHNGLDFRLNYCVTPEKIYSF